MTSAAANTGNMNERTLMNSDSPSSTVAMIGFASPPVVEVEAARVKTVPL